MGILACPAYVPAADDYRTALDSFSGEWGGELKIRALDGFLLKTFTAQRSYSWNGSSQVVITRFFDGESDYETRAHQVVELGRLHSSVNRPGQPVEEYVGKLEAGAVVWKNTSNIKRDYTERLVTTDGVTRLEFASSEIMRVKGVSGVVRISGLFERSAVARVEHTPEVFEAEGAAEAKAADQRIAELERQLAAARHAAAEAESGAIREGRETEELRARMVTLEGQLRDARTASSATVTALQDLLDRREAELGELRAQAEDAAARLAALEQQLRVAESQPAAAAEDATAKLAAAQAAQHTAEARATDLEAKLEDAERAGAEHATKAARLDQELTVLRADMQQLRSGSSAENARLQELERRLAAAEEERNHHAEAARQMQQSYASARADQAVAESRLTELQATVVAAEENLASSRTQAEEIQRERAAAAAEADRLAARVTELETAAAKAEEARRAALAASSDTSREQIAQRERIATLEGELAASRQARIAAESAAADERASAAALEQARASATAHIAELEAELAKVLEKNRALTGEQERLAAAARAAEQNVLAASSREAGDLATARAEAERLSARVAELESELAASSARASAASSAAADLASAQADAGAARQRLSEAASERDIFRNRLAGANEALAEKHAALQQAESSATRLRHELSAATAQLQQLEAVAASAASTAADLAAQQHLAAERAREVARLEAALGEATRERDELALRLATLEAQAPAPTTEQGAPVFSLSASPSPAVAAAHQELQAELARLQRRVTELESERNSARTSLEIFEGQLEQARALRDNTLARFQEVVAELNAMRDERDQLARANASLQSELRAASGPGATPAPPSATDKSPSFLDRLLGNTEPAARDAAAPSASKKDVAPVPDERAIHQRIDQFQVIGITQTPEEDKVILNGRLYRSNDIVDATLGIVFVRIDGDALVFADHLAREYRRRF